MKNKIWKSVRIDRENQANIELVLKKYNIAFSTFINLVIYRFFENKYDKNLKVNLTTNCNNKSKSIRVELSDKEYDFLLNLAKYNGFNSVKQEIKFLLLNSIASEKLFNNIEMIELINATNDLNKLGRNINEIVKLLRQKKSYEFNVNFNKLADFFSDINNQILEINKLISGYRKILNLKIANN